MENSVPHTLMNLQSLSSPGKKTVNDMVWWPDLEAVLMTSLILLLSSFSTDEARESSGDPDEEASLSIKCSNDE